jgi:DNA-binding response OmpR family regulator
MLPYVFVVALSAMSRIREIEDAQAAGADDYLIKPYNPFQIRTRVMVGLRWLAYIDSINPGRKKQDA